MLDFVFIKAQKYRGNVGDNITLEMYVNRNNIAYIEKITDDKFIMHLVGDVSSGYTVTDFNSITALRSIAGIDK